MSVAFLEAGRSQSTERSLLKVEVARIRRAMASAVGENGRLRECVEVEGRDL